jgi:hypothetical protein
MSKKKQSKSSSPSLGYKEHTLRMTAEQFEEMEKAARQDAILGDFRPSRNRNNFCVRAVMDAVRKIQEKHSRRNEVSQ